MVLVGRKKRNEMIRVFRFRKYHTRASALLKSSLEPRLFLLDSVTWNCERKPGTWKACVWGWLKAAWSCYYVGDKVQNTSIILWHVILENKAVFSLCTKSPSMRLPPSPTHTHTHKQTLIIAKAPHDKHCRPMQLASKIVQVNHWSRYPASCAWSPKMDSSFKCNTDSYICPKPHR